MLSRDRSQMPTWARLAAVVAVALPLAACGSGGFQPLHGPTASGAPLDERLAQLEVAPIPGRVGQRIRNELVFQNTNGVAPSSPTHRVEVVTTEALQSALVKIDGNSSSQVYQLEANFRILDLRSKKIVFQGRSLGRAGFERFEFDLFQRARPRGRREPRRADRRDGSENAARRIHVRHRSIVIVWIPWSR